MNRYSKMAVMAACGLALLMGSGCRGRGSDLLVSVQDARGLATESKVLWKGTEVGQVKAVRPEAGRLMIEVELWPSYRGALRQGAIAKPMNGVFTRFVPVLEIYGGDDPGAAPLAHGAVLPEATNVQTFRHGPYLKWVGVAGILLLIGLLLRGVKRFLLLLLALVFLTGGLWVMRQQWLRHKSELLGPQTEARLEELANNTIKSPEAADAWRIMRSDINALVVEARTRSYQAATSAWAQVDMSLKRRIDDLESQGQVEAAEELSTLHQRLADLIPDR